MARCPNYLLSFAAGLKLSLRLSFRIIKVRALDNQDLQRATDLSATRTLGYLFFVAVYFLLRRIEERLDKTTIVSLGDYKPHDALQGV
jgi:hypothetical protein